MRLVSAPTPPVDIAVRLARPFAERAAGHDGSGTFPVDNFDDVRRSGLAGLTVPLSRGGMAAGLATTRTIVGILAEADAPTALILAMQFGHHVGIGRSPAWPRHLAERVQAGAAGDGELLNILRVEPELGSPARGGLPATTARRDGDGWRLDGRKIYSTGSTGLFWALVWAKTDEDAPRTGLFLVPMDAAGIRIEETWAATGMRATASHDVVFDDVAIPADHAVDLRPPGAWAVADPFGLAWTTTLNAAVYDGVARAAQAWFASFLRERVPSNLGTPLAHLPRFQDIVGENERLLFVNETLLDAACAAVDVGRPNTIVRSGLVKATVTENAITVVQRAVEASGNHGLSRANPLERHLRDVLCARIHTPQGDSVRLSAGRFALGIEPRSA